jgi:hypothetical protein
VSRVREIFVQLLKFGVSGILGVCISAALYYGFRARLPQEFVTFWFMTSHRLDLVELSYYLLTTIIGGSIHFALSKAWVFVKER